MRGVCAQALQQPLIPPVHQGNTDVDVKICIFSVAAHTRCLCLPGKLVCLFAAVLSLCVYIVYFVGLHQHDVVLNALKISLVSHTNKYLSIIGHHRVNQTSTSDRTHTLHSTVTSHSIFLLNQLRQFISALLFLHDIVFQAANHVLRIILTNNKCLLLKGK